MGKRLTQRIYVCDVCGKTPEDGQYMWHMNDEVWCSDCVHNAEEEQEEADEPAGCQN